MDNILDLSNKGITNENLNSYVKFTTDKDVIIKKEETKKEVVNNAILDIKFDETSRELNESVAQIIYQYWEEVDGNDIEKINFALALLSKIN